MRKKLIKFSVQCLFSDLKSPFHLEPVYGSGDLKTKWPQIMGSYNIYSKTGDTPDMRSTSKQGSTPKTVLHS